MVINSAEETSKKSIFSKIMYDPKDPKHLGKSWRIVDFPSSGDQTSDDKPPKHGGNRIVEIPHTSNQTSNRSFFSKLVYDPKDPGNLRRREKNVGRVEGAGTGAGWVGRINLRR